MVEQKYVEFLNEEDYNLLSLFQDERGISKRTMYGYYTALGLYVSYCNMHLQEQFVNADEVKIEYTKFDGNNCLWAIHDDKVVSYSIGVF